MLKTQINVMSFLLEKTTCVLLALYRVQVLETVRDLCLDYTRSRLQRLSARELATVKVCVLATTLWYASLHSKLQDLV